MLGKKKYKLLSAFNALILSLNPVGIGFHLFKLSMYIENVCDSIKQSGRFSSSAGELDGWI